MNKIAVNLALSFFAVLLTLAGVEIISAFALPFVRPRLTQFDPVLGWKYRPTGHLPKKYFSKNVVYDVKINSDGFRDDEFGSDQKPFRVMVLGDSMTFGEEAGQEDIFTSILEHRLREEFKTGRIDVMNFGVSGYGTGQELLCLKEYGPRYSPGIVILIMFDGNDFEDNVNRMGPGRFRPVFRVQEERLVLDDLPRGWEKLTAGMRDKSVLLSLLASRIKNLLARDENRATEEEKVGLMLKIMEAMDGFTRANQMKFLVFYLNAGRSVRAAARWRAVRDYSRDRAIFFRRFDIREPEIRVRGRGHLNREGNRRLADRIYRDLVARHADTLRQ